MAKKPEGAWDSGSRGEGVNWCKGGWGNGPDATGPDGSVGLGQNARQKGTWVGSPPVCWEKGPCRESQGPEGKGGDTHWRTS